METWRIKLFMDGACPLCQHEMRWLKGLDHGRERIVLEDISDPSFDASKFGFDQGHVVLRLHGILPNGQVMQGMEAFRCAYAAVGFGWLLAPTGWPVLRPMFDEGYSFFARVRLLWRGVPGGPCNSACPSEPRQ